MLDSNILTPREVSLLIEAAEPAHRSGDGRMISTNYHLLIKTAVFTGMRSGELRGLQWDDVDWSARQLHVRRAWKEGEFTRPKTQASVRRIDLPEFLISELREWRLACPKGQDGLVRVPAHDGHDSEPMADTIPTAWRTVFRRHGGHFDGRIGTLSAMISERRPPLSTRDR